MQLNGCLSKRDFDDSRAFRTRPFLRAELGYGYRALSDEDGRRVRRGISEIDAMAASEAVGGIHDVTDSTLADRRRPRLQPRSRRQQTTSGACAAVNSSEAARA